MPCPWILRSAPIKGCPAWGCVSRGTGQRKGCNPAPFSRFGDLKKQHKLQTGGTNTKIAPESTGSAVVCVSCFAPAQQLFSVPAELSTELLSSQKAAVGISSAQFPTRSLLKCQLCRAERAQPRTPGAARARTRRSRPLHVPRRGPTARSHSEVPRPCPAHPKRLQWCWPQPCRRHASICHPRGHPRSIRPCYAERLHFAMPPASTWRGSCAHDAVSTPEHSWQR